MFDPCAGCCHCIAAGVCEGARSSEREANPGPCALNHDIIPHAMVVLRNYESMPYAILQVYARVHVHQRGKAFWGHVAQILT